MAELEDVRIDGNPISATPSDVLPKGFVISWDCTAEYDGYQIRIGSSEDEWGSDNFDGNIANVSQPSLPSSEHAFNFAGGLVRAKVFFGQLKLLNNGSWLKFKIRIKTVPQVSANYSENSLGINTILSIDVTPYSNDAEYRIEWYCNGTRIFAIDDRPSLPSSYLRFGDEWFARVIPFDSLESGAPVVLSALTVDAVSSFSSYITIHPTNPTSDDILYASYDASTFADVNQNAVSFIHRWFVNNEMVSPPTNEPDTDGGRWARLRVVPGDEVFVQVQSLVAGAEGQISTSESVEIGASSRSFSPVLVDGRASDNTSNSLSPTITWRYPDADDLEMRVKIGSLPSDGFYWEETVPASSGIAVVPEGVLLPGLTYYITLSIDGSESISDVIRFSTPGNPWLSSASNSDGWRLQFGMFCVKNSDSSPTVLYPYSLDVSDDILLISLDISPSALRLRSGSNIVYTGIFDMTVEKQVGLSCIGKTVAVHVNSVQVFNGSISGQEIFSTSKYVQISPRSRDSTSYDLTISSVSFAKSFSPAQEIGAYPLGSLPCSSVSHISQSSSGFSVVGSDGTASSDTVYFVSPSVYPRVYDCSVIGQSGSGISLISGDSYGQHVIVAHPFGATVISGSAVDEWSLSCNFTSKSSLDASGFSSVSSHGTDPFAYQQNDYLIIDTTFSNVGVEASSQNAVVNVAKIESRLGIEVYKFSLSSGVLSAEIVSNEFTDTFKNYFSISLIDSNIASVIQQLNQVDISANTDVIPFSLYYNASVTSGYEGVNASFINDFDLTESSPLLLKVLSKTIFAGLVPMGSASGRKAYIETMRGSTIWSQYALDEGGYTMELSFAYEKIEESLASDSVDESGIGLSWFDGKTKHNINIETEKVIIDGNQVALSEAGQQIDVLISKNSTGTSAFMKLGGSMEWNGPFEIAESTGDMVSGTCFDPKIACSSDGASMVAVWWSDDGGNQPVSWMSWWSQDSGWSLPTRMYGDMPSSRPDILWSSSLGVYQVCLTSLDGSSAAIMHSAIFISGKLPKIQPYSRVALARSATCSGQVSVDGVDAVHVVWNDNISGHDELYHAYLPDSGGWSSGGSNGYKVTSTLGGVKNHKIVYSSNNLFVVFESLDGVGGSKIAMARYLVSKSRWESSGAGLVDIQLSSAMDSFASSRPSIASSQDGNCHVCWDDFIRKGTTPSSHRCIMYRSFNPSLTTLSTIVIVANDDSRDCTHASVSCPTDPVLVALAYLKRSVSVSGLSGVRQEQLGDVPTIHLTQRISTQITSSGWPDMGEHKPVVASTARIVSSVNLASSTFKNLHFVYGFSSISRQDRSQREFLNNDTTAYGRVSLAVFSASITQQFLELGSASESTDDVYLARVNEPYIRFGDMSSFRSAKLALYKLRVFVGGGYAPRQITFIGSAAQSLPAKNPSDVDIGASGDAFIVSDGHVFHYDWQSESLFDMSSETARAITHLPAPAAEAQSCYFDSDGNMLVLTQAGDVYVSYDLFRFVPFNFGAPVVKIVKSDGLYIVKSSKLFYIKNWNRYVSQIPSSQPSSAIAVAEDDMEEICDFNGGDVAHSNILGVCLIGQFGVRRIVDGFSVDVGSLGSFGSQRVVSLIDGHDGNVYCATSSRVFRLDGSRWTPLLLASSSGSRTNLGQIFSISKLADKLMVACEYGVFESRPSGSYMVGSMIANSSLYLVPPSRPIDTSSYEFSMPASETIESDSVLQVSINGRLVNVGFGVSQEDASRRVVKFACPLLAEDNVSLVVRDDLRLIRKLNPNRAEVASGYSSTRKLNHVADGGLEFYAVADAGERSVVKLSSSSGLPSDEVVLDTEPPQGKLNFVSQISANVVRLSIDTLGSEDGQLPYDATSGVSTYEISNFSNFTTNGVTPVEPKPFTAQFDHSLLNLSALSGLIWNETSGMISGFVSFRPASALSARDFVFTSFPAACRSKTGDNFSGTQTMIGTDPVNSEIAGVIVFRNELYVAVVKSGENVAIYKSSDGAQFVSVSHLEAEGFAGFFLSDYDNSLYMLTDSPARIYYYTGSGSPSAKVNFVADRGSGISGFDRFVVVATGQDKRIYRADLGSVPIVVESLHYDSDALTTVDSLGTNIYVGTASSGRIMRSVDEDEPFLASFRSTTAPIHAVKKIVLAGRDNIFASVGRQIYRYANGWVVMGQSDADIVGIGQSTDNQVVFWTASSLYAVNVSGAVRRVYLRLADKAGNSTVLASEPDENGDGINDNLVLDISSSLLRSSAISGQIIEFEGNGDTTVVIGNGDAPFFSADRIRRESAVVETEILNASDGHVAWGTMSWVSVTPPDSEIWIYFKVGRTRDQCASAEYGTPITSVVEEFDMSGQVGQFIQIKIVLMSTSPNSNPIMQQISIESLTNSTSQFITTTFVLPSPVKRGILSMDKLVPVSAMIVPCLDTLDRVSIADFQELPENRLFSVDGSQYGTKLRVGFKFLTPASFIDDGTSSGNSQDIYSNTVLWNIDNSHSQIDDVVDFSVYFYDDQERTSLRASANTIDSPQYFLFDGLPFPNANGATILLGRIGSFAMLPYAFSLVSGTTYYVDIDVIRNGVEQNLSELSRPFIKEASVSMYNIIAFEFVPSDGFAGAYDFRIRIYEDEALTQMVGSYFSLANSSGWTAGDSDDPWLPTQPPFFGTQDPTRVTFTPPSGDIEVNNRYFITIESFNGHNFSFAFVGLTFMNIIETGFDCGDQVNVPILKGFSMMFELENGSLVKFNSLTQ
jgi:hypothetical protein